MQVTVQLNLKDNIAPADLLAWLSLGQMLDSGQAFSEKPNAAETADLRQDFAARAQEIYAGSPPNQAPVQTGEPVSAAPSPAPEPRKPGRPRKTAVATPPAATPPVGFEQPPGAVYQPPPANMIYQPPAAVVPATPDFSQQAAYPPGAYPPGIDAPPAQQPAVAMPAAAPPQTYVNGAEMRLEDFKAEAFQIQTAAAERGLQAAYPFNMIRSNTWPDGTPKSFSTMQMDSVPPDQRRKVLDACLSLMMG